MPRSAFLPPRPPVPPRARDTLTWGAIALGLLLAACHVNPVTERPELSFLSEEEEIRAGEQEDAALRGLVGTGGNEAMRRYVETIGLRLAVVSHRPQLPYHFAILDLAEPNAFALPGGYIYVTRGLLAATNSEAELAGVLGHEIGHVAARHAVQRLTKTALYDPFRRLKGFVVDLAAPVRDLTGILAVDVAAAVPDLVFAAVLQKYSRGDEREADALGIRYAEEAGFDPHGLPAFLLSLKRIAEAGGGVRRASFLDSHPLEGERIRTLDRRLRNHPSGATDRRRYLERIAGVLFGEDPSRGVVTEQGMFFHPGEAWGIRMPEGWNVSRGRDGVLALPPDGESALLHVSGIPGEESPGDARRHLLETLGEARGLTVAVVVQDEESAGGLPAASTTLRVQTREGAVGIYARWIELAGTTHQVLGIAPLPRFEAALVAFRASARSFRGMTEEERDAIPYRRVRLHQVLPGETLASIARDAGPGGWSAEELSIWNGLPEAESPPAASWLKVLRVESRGGLVAAGTRGDRP